MEPAYIKLLILFLIGFVGTLFVYITALALLLYNKIERVKVKENLH